MTMLNNLQFRKLQSDLIQMASTICKAQSSSHTSKAHKLTLIFISLAFNHTQFILPEHRGLVLQQQGAASLQPSELTWVAGYTKCNGLPKLPICQWSPIQVQTKTSIKWLHWLRVKTNELTPTLSSQQAEAVSQKLTGRVTVESAKSCCDISSWTRSSVTVMMSSLSFVQLDFITDLIQ